MGNGLIMFRLHLNATSNSQSVPRLKSSDGANTCKANTWNQQNGGFVPLNQNKTKTACGTCVEHCAAQNTNIAQNYSNNRIQILSMTVIWLSTLLCFNLDSSVEGATVVVKVLETLGPCIILHRPDMDWPAIDVFHLREGVGGGHTKTSDATQPTLSDCPSPRSTRWLDHLDLPFQGIW